MLYRGSTEFITLVHYMLDREAMEFINLMPFSDRARGELCALSRDINLFRLRRVARHDGPRCCCCCCCLIESEQANRKESSEREGSSERNSPRKEDAKEFDLKRKRNSKSWLYLKGYKFDSRVGIYNSFIAGK